MSEVISREEAVKILMRYNVLPTPDILEELAKVKTIDDMEGIIDKYSLRTKETIPSNVVVLQSYQEHMKKREINDFVIYYNNRFKVLSNMLKSRDIPNLTSIKRVTDIKNEEVSIIGMIFNIEVSKNGHYIITLEDKTGLVKVLISKDKKDLFDMAKNLVLDETIAITGMSGDNIIFGQKIYLPDIPLDKIIKKSPYEGDILFISDIHVGSSYFFKDEFENFLSFVQKNKTIKYIFISGDLIDGVGAYPGQDKELTMLSVKDQINKIAEYLSRLSKDIKIIICPGNHDPVRIAEPQPPLSEKFCKALTELPNVTLVSSPAIVNIEKTDTFEGFNVLMYHGFSMPYYGDKVPEIRENGGLSRMELIMKFYLQRRHFAPSHGSTQFIPDIMKDSLVIEKVPDFFVTGHVHKVVVQNYRGVTMINASGWIKQTEYQKRFGLVPDNCRAIIINMKTRDVNIVDFSKQEEQIKKENNGIAVTH